MFDLFSVFPRHLSVYAYSLEIKFWALWTIPINS